MYFRVWINHSCHEPILCGRLSNSILLEICLIIFVIKIHWVMPGMYNIIKWAWHHFMQSFWKPNYIAESSISKLGEIIKSSNNYCLIKKWYGGYNSDYTAKSYKYDKRKQQEMGRKMHSENLRNEKILDKSRVIVWTEFILFRMWSSCGWATVNIIIKSQ